MSLNADQKVGMSLDDLIKARKAAQPAKTSAKKAAGTKKTAAKPNAATNTKKKKGGKASATSAETMKIAKSVGGAKAKRAATVSQRRGLSTTGKASKMDVEKAVSKEAAKKTKAKRNKKGIAGVAGTGAQAGLKISFKPGELKQTTDKVVVQQIQAVLSKQGSAKSGKTTASNNTKPRSVFSSTPTVKVAENTESSGRRSRRNPKVRSKTGIVRVKR